jgi:hypothetical protein
VVDTIEEFHNLIGELKESLRFFETETVDMETYLQKLPALGRYLIEEEYSGATIRKITKVLRNVYRIVKKIQKARGIFESRLEDLNISINNFLPGRYRKRFVQNSKKMEIIFNFILKFYSKRGALWNNRKDGALLLTKLKNSQRGGIRPLLAVIESYKTLILDVEKDLENIQFNFNIDNVLKTVDAPVDRTVVIIDADFASNADHYRKIRRKIIRLVNNATLEIPKTVLKEMIKIPKSKKAALVSKDFRRQLLKSANLISIRKNLTYEDTIINYWKKTPKGSSNENKIREFKRGGDIKIMLRALELNPIPVVILSNDNDIYQTIRAMQNAGIAMHISVHAFQDDGTILRVA